MIRITFIVLAFFIMSNIFGQRRIDIYSTKNNRGQYCYILWTTDTTKCNPNKTHAKLVFDKNNIVYVHFDMQKINDSIRIFSNDGQNISTHMINIMSGDSYEYLFFYNPTENEIKNHPYFDSYYREKLIMKPTLKKYLPESFRKLGYNVEKRKTN